MPLGAGARHPASSSVGWGATGWETGPPVPELPEGLVSLDGQTGGQVAGHRTCYSA